MKPNELGIEMPMPIISSYTRAEAIEDGVLVDVSETAREAGFKVPVAVSRAVHERYIRVPAELEGLQDEAGRLWDVLWMLFVEIRRQKGANPEELEYKLYVRKPDKGDWIPSEKFEGGDRELRLVTLKAAVGPGDNFEPVVTIMLPSED